MTLSPAVVASLPARVREVSKLSGGDTHPAYRVESDQGPLFVKTDGAPGQFVAEARSLEAMRASGTSLRIPRVVSVSDDALCLEWLPPGRCRDVEARLGQGLATLHSARAERFGFESPTWCGPTRQANRWHADFVSFYRDERLVPVLTLAHRRDALDEADLRETQRLVDRLPELLRAVAGPPRLIHGDLWSGNVVETAEGPALVDPACAYSHPEAELGMMTLFGGFSARTLAAYREALPLEPEWEARQPLFQLYHLLNHAAIFGGSYGRQAMETVRRFV